ncbi:sulfite exporter TauE/SafE family protein [Patulibacter defluvii]|uniref:sulfite exporter TauE/SafE family protein n=1 Tax=Patulibacter defluvii TaxID=3095358 RepID=UPI002A74D80B|nr:sulfite exporter TauE/SafE family protein [Patulibacter sp. DM4]
MTTQAIAADGLDGRERTLRLAAIGLVGGFLSGLLGIGGGTVMVPLFVLALGMAQRHAHALSLAAIIPISIVAVATYGAAGKVDLLDGALLAAGSIFGARLGAGILSRAPERQLKLAFGGFLLLAAASVVLKG